MSFSVKKMTCNSVQKCDASSPGYYFYSARMHYINHLHIKLIRNKFSMNNNKGLLDTKSAY